MWSKLQKIILINFHSKSTPRITSEWIPADTRATISSRDLLLYCVHDRSTLIQVLKEPNYEKLIRAYDDAPSTSSYWRRLRSDSPGVTTTGREGRMRKVLMCVGCRRTDICCVGGGIRQRSVTPDGADMRDLLNNLKQPTKPRVSIYLEGCVIFVPSINTTKPHTAWLEQINMTSGCQVAAL